MKDKDIIAELDSLKMRILIEGVEKEPTDLERYDRWIDEIMGRKEPCDKWKPWEVFIPREYTECKTVASIVQDLFHKKHCDRESYLLDKPEIQEIVKEAVFMTEFVRKEIFGKPNPTQKGVSE